MRSVNSYDALDRFGRICSFNISWHKKLKKNITSYLKPRVLLKNGHDTHGFSEWFADFPTFKRE